APGAAPGVPGVPGAVAPGAVLPGAPAAPVTVTASPPVVNNSITVAPENRGFWRSTGGIATLLGIVALGSGVLTNADRLFRRYSGVEPGAHAYAEGGPSHDDGYGSYAEQPYAEEYGAHEYQEHDDQGYPEQQANVQVSADPDAGTEESADAGPRADD
ncbi:MAG: hypothetical protein QM634_15075, partial [Gordonia sp. (in: high G+C Gram-positive bacteria)]